MTKRLGFLLLVAAIVLPIVGCGTPDSDPNAKVNEPGYYNGPMKSKNADNKSNDK